MCNVDILSESTVISEDEPHLEKEALQQLLHL